MYELENSASIPRVSVYSRFILKQTFYSNSNCSANLYSKLLQIYELDVHLNFFRFTGVVTASIRDPQTSAYSVFYTL